MRYFLATLCAFLITNQAFSGGMSGGTGIGGIISDINQSLQDILKLPKLDIDPATFRRLLIRLAFCGRVEIRVNGQIIVIKAKLGRLVDNSETMEIVSFNSH